MLTYLKVVNTIGNALENTTEYVRLIHLWKNGEVHRKKSFSIFPSPAGMSPTKLSLGGNNDIIYKLFGK